MKQSCQILRRPQWSIMQSSYNIAQTPSETQPSAQDWLSNTDVDLFIAWKPYYSFYIYIFTLNYKIQCTRSSLRTAVFPQVWHLGPLHLHSLKPLYILHCAWIIQSWVESTAGLLLGEGKMQTDCGICACMITRLRWCFWVMYCEKSLLNTSCSTLLTTFFGAFNLHQTRVLQAHAACYRHESQSLPVSRIFSSVNASQKVNLCPAACILQSENI